MPSNSFNLVLFMNEKHIKFLSHRIATKHEELYSDSTNDGGEKLTSHHPVRIDSEGHGVVLVTISLLR